MTSITLHTLRSLYRDDILAMAAMHKLENVRVFGSTVRGEAKAGSDIDLLVHPKKGRSLLDISKFEVAAQGLLGRKVDVVDDMAIKEMLAPFILSEAVPL